MHFPQRQSVCIHCYYWHLEPRLTTTMINFLQYLPHLVVCSSQVVTRFQLNICTVEVVDTGRHLTHLYFSIKVVLIMVIIPISCQMRPHVNFQSITNMHITVAISYVKPFYPSKNVKLKFDSLCVYIAIISTQNQGLHNPSLIFLQDLPHLVVCISQVVTRFHLNICTVEVVDTGRHLTHLYLLIKVVLNMVIIPFSYQASTDTMVGAEGANTNVCDSRASIWWVMLTRCLKYEYLKYPHNRG